MSTDLFASAHTPIDLIDETSSDHLEQDDPCPRVEDLFTGCAIALVLHVRRSGRALAVYTYTEIVGNVQVPEA